MRNRTAGYGFSKESIKSFTKTLHNLYGVKNQVSDLFDEVYDTLIDASEEISELDGRYDTEELDRVIPASKRAAEKIEADLKKTLDHFQYLLRELRER